MQEVELMDWIDLEDELPRVCQDILFTDGKKVYAGWLETYEEKEDLVFYDKINEEWPIDVVYWMPFPAPPPWMPLY